MAIHSAMTRETGSTATDTGRLRYCIRGEWCSARRGRGVVGREGAGETNGSIIWGMRASWFIIAICRRRGKYEDEKYGFRLGYASEESIAT